jgi:hypothetical protein
MPSFSVYCLGAPTPSTFDSMAAAMKAACDMIISGKTVLRIKSTDGFLMERTDVEMECIRRAGA